MSTLTWSPAGRDTRTFPSSFPTCTETGFYLQGFPWGPWVWVQGHGGDPRHIASWHWTATAHELLHFSSFFLYIFPLSPLLITVTQPGNGVPKAPAHPSAPCQLPPKNQPPRAFWGHRHGDISTVQTPTPWPMDAARGSPVPAAPQFLPEHPHLVHPLSRTPRSLARKWDL